MKNAPKSSLGGNMADFILLNDTSKLVLSIQWTDSKSFKSKGRYINKNFEYVSACYPGTKYLVCIKKERDYTSVERVVRACLGIFLTIITAGTSNLLKNNRKLFTDQKKVLRFAVRFNEEKKEITLKTQESPPKPSA
jgi:hypothetical protein